MGNLTQIKYVDKTNTEYLFNIPSNLSQLVNDIGFMTSDTFNQMVSNYLNKNTGGKLSGDVVLKDSSYVFGSKQAEAGDVLTAYTNTFRSSTGCFGSISTNIPQTLGGVTVPAGWYNYIYIPHRHGTMTGDNYLYGTLILNDMTTANKNTYIMNFAGGTLQKCFKVADEQWVKDNPKYVFTLSGSTLSLTTNY